jgi:starch phosphorylase
LKITAYIQKFNKLSTIGEVIMVSALPNNIQIEDDRTGISIETLKRAFLDNLFYIQAKFPKISTKNDYYMALAYTVRDRLLNRWLNTTQSYLEKAPRMVTYLSAEFLMGPHLGNNLINLGIYDSVKQAIEELGLNLNTLLEQEEEPGLGNGGLGRLAACYIDSLATLQIPAIGYGIRYEYGIFDQEIKDGWQVEITDKWLRYGNPWEVVRPEAELEVKFGGKSEAYLDDRGHYRTRWVPYKIVKGVPYDTPIMGFRTNTVNTLRLWKAEAPESFDFEAFNKGDYFGAVQEKSNCENITKVLYPNDSSSQGKQLRLEQQYFFVSCSLQDMIRIMKTQNQALENFHEHFAVQLNDTHPTIAVAELMRLLLDEYGFEWDKAWNITTKTFAYTNHTLLPEALERWSVSLFGSLLPRHLEIVYEINSRFLNEVRIKFPDDSDRLRRMSIIDESGERYVRMAYLACVGSHTINGVAELHSDLLKKTTLHDFYEMYPEKFANVTNGVTPRRFMVLSNPRLANLITSKIGDSWIKNLDELKKLEHLIHDPDFCNDFRQVKQSVKQDLTDYIRENLNIKIDPNSLFDIQVKRIHEYKRQHLNALYIITLYNRIKANPNLEITPRTFLFGGKAAPGYYMAKLIIKLINSIAEVVNNDPDVRDRLKVVFMKDYNVKFAQRVYPAADLSEQISTAGKEASGTGNMKFSMNGALTIGTLDGANVEIREAVGADNFFLFGLTTEEVLAKKAAGYNPWDYYNSNPELKLTIDRLSSGFFSHGDPDLFKPLLDSLLYQDDYLLFADFQSYIECQDRISEVYRDQDHWTRMSILNMARMGKFSSDRSIEDYLQYVWKALPVQIEVPEYSQVNGDLKLTF